MQPWCTPFPIWNHCIVPCLVLTVASWPAYRLLRRQVRWSGILNTFKNFPQFIVIRTVKGFSIVNEAELQFSSVAQPCPTLYDPMDCSMPGSPVHHQLLDLTQIHVHWVGDAIKPSHPLSSPSPPAFNLSKHQGLFKWLSCLHQVAKVLEFQFQHQSFQWIFRTDFL